jgi:hypothetical protein
LLIGRVTYAANDSPDPRITGYVTNVRLPARLALAFALRDVTNGRDF